MLLKPWQLKQVRMGLPATPCNRSSDNSSSTAATTTNTDRRTVNDRGLSVSGDGNYVNATMTDAGSVAAAFDFATTNTQTAFASTQDAIGLAGDVVRLGAEQNKVSGEQFLSQFGKLLDFAKDTTAIAKTSTETASTAIAKAYENVQDIGTGQRFMVAGGLLILGVVAASKIKA